MEKIWRQRLPKHRKTSQKQKFQKSQPEEQRESRAEGNHYGVREGTSKNLNQTANLLSRGKSEIPWRGIKENQNQGFLDEGNIPTKVTREILHTSLQEQPKGRNPYEEPNLTKIPQKKLTSGSKGMASRPKTQEGKRRRSIIWSPDNQKKLS